MVGATLEHDEAYSINVPFPVILVMDLDLAVVFAYAGDATFQKDPY